MRPRAWRHAGPLGRRARSRHGPSSLALFLPPSLVVYHHEGHIKGVLAVGFALRDKLECIVDLRIQNAAPDHEQGRDVEQ
jgi:hypothetical protein